MPSLISVRTPEAASIPLNETLHPAGAVQRFGGKVVPRGHRLTLSLVGARTGVRRLHVPAPIRPAPDPGCVTHSLDPERTLGPPDQQVTINLCRNCIARRAGWNMFPEGPGDVVMHTI